MSLGDEEIVFQWPVQKKECCHTGGGMHFDDLGDLYLSIGNNEGRGSDGMNETDSIDSGEWGASSTASVRGGIIRIRPLETAVNGRLYAIPKGNFGEYWADKFAAEGKPAALVAEYRDPKKVLPEIYVKGNRNPYGIAVDRVRRWVAVGDVGPSRSPSRQDGSGDGRGPRHVSSSRFRRLAVFRREPPQQYRR
jgi:cytochrome c